MSSSLSSSSSSSSPSVALPGRRVSEGQRRWCKKRCGSCARKLGEGRRIYETQRGTRDDRFRLRALYSCTHMRAYRRRRAIFTDVWYKKYCFSFSLSLTHSHLWRGAKTALNVTKRDNFQAREMMRLGFGNISLLLLLLFFFHRKCFSF